MLLLPLAPSLNFFNTIKNYLWTSLNRWAPTKQRLCCFCLILCIYKCWYRNHLLTVKKKDIAIKTAKIYLVCTYYMLDTVAITSLGLLCFTLPTTLLFKYSHYSYFTNKNCWHRAETTALRFSTLFPIGRFCVTVVKDMTSRVKLSYNTFYHLLAVWLGPASLTWFFLKLKKIVLITVDIQHYIVSGINNTLSNTRLCNFAYSTIKWNSRTLLLFQLELVMYPSWK